MPTYRPFIFASITLASSLATLMGSSSLAFADAGPKTSAHAHAHAKTDSVAAPVAKRHRTNVESISITTTVEAAPATTKKDAVASNKKTLKPNAHLKHGHVVSPQAKKDVKEASKPITLEALPAPESKDAPLKNVVDAGGKKKTAKHGDVNTTAEVAPKHVGRADHAVEPESTPKVEATLDPTIHFVPMSATTMAPMETTIETGNLKTGKVTTTVTASTGKDGAPITTVTSSTKKDGKKKDAKACLHSQVDILRGVEEEKLSLTKCDGTVAPGAVERLSILVRPSSASRPIASLTELSKIKGPELAPGVKKIDPLLVSHLETVVDHFSKKNDPAKVFVISGYRPGAAGSFHQSGKALDFRIDGVKNEELVAFCKTLQDTGCGYYPNSSFVHMDIRTPNSGHVSWIDSSGPGEEPRYVSAWPPPAEPMKHDRSEAKSALTQADKEMPPVEADDHPSDPEAIGDMNQAPPADIAVPADDGTTGDN